MRYENVNSLDFVGIECMIAEGDTTWNYFLVLLLVLF
jgi:hypothetical protein